MTDIPVNASAFGGNEPIASADGHYCIPTTAPEARAYLGNLRRNTSFVDVLTNPLDSRHVGYGHLVKALEMVGQRDRGERAAQDEANRQRQNAAAEAAERAPLAEKLGLFREFRR
jgi:hypothetical protein